MAMNFSTCAVHSRLALALADSALAVIAQWSTVAVFLMYLGIVGGARPAGKAKASARV